MRVLGIAFEETLESRLVVLSAAIGTVIILARIILKYDKTFIADQDREIDSLRAEISAARSDAREARDESILCHRERAVDRVRIGELEQEVAQLRRDVDQ